MSTATMQQGRAGPPGTVGTVLIRLAGPMQAWDRTPRTHGGGGVRPTQDHPTKTGVVGLVANVLGRDRADDVSDLAGLAFAVRADRPGTHEVDYHTAGSGDFPFLPGEVTFHSSAKVRKAAQYLPEGVVPTMNRLGAMYAAPRSVKPDLTASPVGRTTVVSKDEYLADAVFTVALTGPAGLVQRIHEALHTPARMMHLGRAAYPPTGQVGLDVTDHADPVVALTEHPRDERAQAGRLRVWAQTLPGKVVHDNPVHYGTRQVTTRMEGSTWVTPPAAPSTDATGESSGATGTVPLEQIPDMFAPADDVDVSVKAEPVAVGDSLDGPDLYTPPAAEEDIR